MTVSERSPSGVPRVMTSPAFTPSLSARAEPTTASSASSEGHVPVRVHHERRVVTPATTLSPVGSASSLLNQVPKTARSWAWAPVAEVTSTWALSWAAKSTML